MRKPARVSARRKRRPSLRPSLFLVPLVLILSLLLIRLVMQKSVWDGKNRFVVAVSGLDGGVSLLVFDPLSHLITTIDIPSNTSLELSHQLGTWKLGSVWHLGKQEKIGGRLLKDTITKSLLLPVDAWAEAQAMGFARGSLPSLIRAVIAPYDTSLNFKDKLNLALFSIKVQSGERLFIDLSRSGYLTKTQLLSGEEGYTVKSAPPLALEKLFSVEDVAREKARIAIYDSSSAPSVASVMTNVINILGTKVVSIQKADKSDIDCQITTRPKLATSRIIARIFSCKLQSSPPEGNYDIEIKVGESFAKRF